MDQEPVVHKVDIPVTRSVSHSLLPLDALLQHEVSSLPLMGGGTGGARHCAVGKPRDHEQREGCVTSASLTIDMTEATDACTSGHQSYRLNQPMRLHAHLHPVAVAAIHPGDDAVKPAAAPVWARGYHRIRHFESGKCNLAAAHTQELGGARCCWRGVNRRVKLQRQPGWEQALRRPHAEHERLRNEGALSHRAGGHFNAGGSAPVSARWPAVQRASEVVGEVGLRRREWQQVGRKVTVRWQSGSANDCFHFPELGWRGSTVDVFRFMLSGGAGGAAVVHGSLAQKNW